MPRCKVFLFHLLPIAVSACLFFCHSTLVVVCGEGALTATATAAAAADRCSFSPSSPLAVVIVVFYLLLV